MRRGADDGPLPRRNRASVALVGVVCLGVPAAAAPPENTAYETRVGPGGVVVAPEKRAVLPKIEGPGDLPPEGSTVLRGQYVMASGGGAGLENACFNCHGIEGAGQAASAYPRLAGQSAWYQWAQLRAYAIGTRPNPIMSPIAEALSEDDWQAVATYYASRRAPAAASPDADPDLLAHGAKLYERGDDRRGLQPCATCHGEAGRGVPPAMPYLAGQHAGYLADQLVQWQDGVRRDSLLGVMRVVALKLEAHDILAVSAWLATLPPPTATLPREPGS